MDKEGVISKKMKKMGKKMGFGLGKVVNFRNSKKLVIPPFGENFAFSSFKACTATKSPKNEHFLGVVMWWGY